MRARFALLGVLTVGALSLGPAQGQAATLPFTGTLSLSLAGLNFPVIQGAGMAIVTATGSHLALLSIAASPFNALGLGLPITDPAAAPIKGLEVSAHNGAGAFSGGPLGGAMPLNGVAKVCLFKACSNATANISVPLSVVGVGGTTAGSYGADSALIIGAPWTAGTAAVGTITHMGFVHGPASGTSSTAAASGAIRLVTPIFISTSIPASAVIAGFGFLNLHFVPEPSTLLLLAGGIAGLVMFGRSKRG